MMSKPSNVSLALRILLPFSVITALYFFAFGYIQSKRETEEREQELSHLMDIQADMLVVTLAQPMWDFNNQQIRIIIDAMLKHPDIDAITIRDAQRKPIVESKDAEPYAHFFTLERPIVYAHEGKTETLGTVELVISQQALDKALQFHRWPIAIAAGIFILLQLSALCGVLWYLGRIKVTKAPGSQKPAADVKPTVPPPAERPLPIDKDVLSKIAAKPETQKPLLIAFSKQTLQLLPIMEHARRQGEEAKWQQAAHALRESATKLGMHSLATLCEQAESPSTSPQDRTTILEKIKAELLRITEHIATYR